MTVNIHRIACNNTCYSTDTKPWTFSFLLLAVILGAETIITAALLYRLAQELHTTTKSMDHDVFPTECLHQHGHEPAEMHTAGLSSCDLLKQEFQNSVNMRLLQDIRNSLWQSFRDHNITQIFIPAIHVGARQELRQYHHLQKSGESQYSQFTLDCLNWEVLNGHNTQEGLMTLSPDGEIVVPQDGIYFVYSQVHFIASHRGRDFHLVQYLFKRNTFHPGLMMLSKAGVSHGDVSESSVGLYPSHQGALFQLEQGDRLLLCVNSMDTVALQPEETYFGAFIID